MARQSTITVVPKPPVDPKVTLWVCVGPPPPAVVCARTATTQNVAARRRSAHTRRSMARPVVLRLRCAAPLYMPTAPQGRAAWTKGERRFTYACVRVPGEKTNKPISPTCDDLRERLQKVGGMTCLYERTAATPSVAPCTRSCFAQPAFQQHQLTSRAAACLQQTNQQPANVSPPSESCHSLVVMPCFSPHMMVFQGKAPSCRFFFFGSVGHSCVEQSLRQINPILLQAVATERLGFCAAVRQRRL
jgi:hypothetical protein